ncbi:ROK family transcriptional regulator [Amycolatopsis sp. PS_44_ISF1]|uniref:ROK family transcriptional regulator n=1 Tax=Amycolatopsis sp. PS_44_ISF1 TaxID=2974917 RepID=UPI0028DE3FFA|nr:ROK family transcriptional regulator [Amycolatopsis sp. PS_44_ISF1]MDT8912582.1 ROK family protein [Amycolatopsis sp. PS_44_ISF1]
MHRNAASAGAPGFRPPVGGRASLRASNLSRVLTQLRALGPRSRTQLAEDLDLPKATVSALVSELAARELVREGKVNRAGGVGRPQQAVELHGAHLAGLGIEVSAGYVRAIAVNVRGDVLTHRHRTIESPDRALDSIAGLAREAMGAVRANGVDVVGITVASPGEIDPATGVVTFAANLGWTRLPLVKELTDRLGRAAPPLGLGNDAKLGAVAEYGLVAGHGIRDLLYITGDTGIGAGIIAGGRPVTGSTGNAGEVGHMPLAPGGELCACGRRGCWETMVGLTALMRHASDPGDPVRDPRRDLEDRLTEIRARALAGEPRTRAALDRIGADLGLGVGLLIDVLNPQVVVLGGYFSILGDLVIGTAARVIGDQVMSPEAGRCELRISTLGFTSAARGAAQTVIDEVFADPGAAPLRDQPRPLPAVRR